MVGNLPIQKKLWNWENLEDLENEVDVVIHYKSAEASPIQIRAGIKDGDGRRRMTWIRSEI